MPTWNSFVAISQQTPLDLMQSVFSVPYAETRVPLKCSIHQNYNDKDI